MATLDICCSDIQFYRLESWACDTQFDTQGLGMQVDGAVALKKKPLKRLDPLCVAILVYSSASNLHSRFKHAIVVLWWRGVCIPYGFTSE